MRTGKIFKLACKFRDKRRVSIDLFICWVGKAGSQGQMCQDISVAAHFAPVMPSINWPLQSSLMLHYTHADIDDHGRKLLNTVFALMSAIPAMRRTEA